MADLFWSFWDASVRFALLSVLLLVAVPLLRRWVSPKLLCLAWALLVLRLSFPLALPFSGSIFNLNESLQPSTWVNALRSGVVDAGLGETVLPAFRTQDELVKSSLVGFSWENALVTLWVLGFVFFLGGLLKNAVQLHRFFARAERHNSGRLYEIFKDTRRRFGIHANVPLLVSDDVKTPGIAGIFNPRVVIPRFCAEDLSDEEIRCVLLHELTHYRRGDLFLHHLLLLICFVHWYNPLVWLVFRQFKISMEQACDADVVNTESITTVKQYGLTLLQVMKRSRGVSVSPAGALCLLGNRRSSALKDRIHLIAAPRRPTALCLALGLSLFGVSFVYSITGEAESEREGERLLGLTRFAGPLLFVQDRENRYGDLDLGLNSAHLRTPQSWIQQVDVSEFQGQEVLVRVSYSVNASSESQNFWVNIKNQNGFVIANERRIGSSTDETRLQRVEVPIRLAYTAVELEYGLTASGGAGVWIESFEVLTPSGRPKL
ncbi:M56 family metallopeptidase [Pelagicoccus sp. SDUM812003]|uniref:M56 family metallopeptidase n=1 Tax=Pelagicoccus sp. SDUM812003 TaxID=3041267 RepID=UPI00280E2F00|nr:M56 family metallopeptidase [Pelagicoccus sp. SDUM812003]MDQ8202674.1 M56 family metallopeptidase [Pelagicoccus sp. SDUM812003]